MKLPPLTVRAIHSVAVEVPITYALGTSRGVISKAPLLLIDLQTEEGVTGRSYLWCYFPAAMAAVAKMLDEVARTVTGERLAPADLWSKLCERFALIGVQGVVRMAMAGFDVAAWDALAIAAGWPLATLLGSAPKSAGRRGGKTPDSGARDRARKSRGQLWPGNVLRSQRST